MRNLEAVVLTPPPPEWALPEFSWLVEEVQSPLYPCIFATEALRSGGLYLGAAENVTECLKRQLDAFIERIAEHPHPSVALVVFVHSEREMPINYYEVRFWEGLQYLLDMDSCPWPEGRPFDPEAESWMYCYASVPFYVFALAPSPHIRRSRRSESMLAFCFVPNWSFKGWERGTSAGDIVRTHIAARQRRFDNTTLHKSLPSSGFGGAAWKSYFLDGDENLKRCPLRVLRTSFNGQKFFKLE